MKHIVLIFFLFSLVSRGQSPGNINSNLQLWLKADQGTSLTGTNVDSWTDQSTNSFIGASQGSADAQYVAMGLNFNPVVRFFGNSFYNYGAPGVLDINPNTEQMTIITVVVTGGSTTGTVIAKGDSGGRRNYQVWFGTTDRVLHHTLGRLGGSQAVRWGTIYALNEPKITSGVVSNTGNHLTRLAPYVNGILDPADRNDGTFTGGDSSMDILVGARRASGNTGSGYRYNGDIAEIILYDRDLTSIERQKVESYLAIKYGVTLGSNDAYWDTPSNTSSPFGYTGTSNNYFASDGSIIWNGSDNAGYGYNVFGIARDDDSNLLQQKSKSVNVIPEPILTMEAETGALSNNLGYLLAGNNGDDVSLTTAGLPTRSTSVLERKWKVRESATNAGAVTLEFDLSLSPITDVQASNLDLFIADNSSFNNYKNFSGSYNSSTNVLTFTGVNFEDSNYFTLGVPQELIDDYHIAFNEANNYIEDSSITLSDLNNFTLSFWLKPDNLPSSSEDFVIGQADYMDVRLSASSINFNIFSNLGAKATVTRPISAANWVNYTIVVDRSARTIVVYENGSLVSNTSCLFTWGTNTNPLRMGSTYGLSIAGTTNDFDGLLDEFRLFNFKLSEEQIQQMVYQEIENNAGNIKGKVLPYNIGTTSTSTSISWGSLISYYNMSHIRGNCLVDESLSTKNAFLHNIPNSAIQLQTGPMPYETNATGNWSTQSTWLHGNVWDIEDETNNKDWSIVVLNDNHTLTTNNNHSTLGLIIKNNAELIIDGDLELTNTWYLKLDGKIDLEGESQLVQTEDSTLDPTSNGTLEKDQQGTADNFTYNYWSSPVGKTNNATNNNDYNVTDVFTNVNFLSTGYNGTASPLSIADYWIWKFSNRLSDDYASWQHVRQSGTLQVGEGFTMKGPGSGDIMDNQNYILEGKPNNGDINLSISAGNDYLVGNPYPSAIDAQQFILDNGATIAGPGSTTGTLYFWEHWGGESHIANEYQGGYATYSLAGGVPAAAIGTTDPDVASGGTPTKIPGQYIPVGQGFFVTAETGGTIKFNNGQRVFQVEDGANSLFVKSNNSTKFNKNEISKKQDNRMKIRIGFNSTNVLRRQLLITIDQKASKHIDWGYDSKYIDTQIDDMYWMINNEKFVIQAIDTITDETIVPLGIHVNKPGINNITLDKLENVPNSLNIYLHDKALDLYHNLRNSKFETQLSAGEYLNRFEITFSKSQTLTSNIVEINETVDIFYSNEKESIIIVNPEARLVKGIEMLNIIGQSLFKLEPNSNKTNIEYKIPGNIAGNYILNIETEIGKISKKILIK